MSKAGARRSRGPGNFEQRPDRVVCKESGLLLDFFTRAKASGRVSRVAGQAEIAAIIRAKGLKQSKNGRLEDIVQDEDGGFHYASVLIDRDKLHFNLLQDLARFWKKQGHPAWTCSGKEVVRQRAMEVLLFKRLELGLKTEVSHWLSEYRQVHGPKRVPQETLHERQGRLKDFWAEYHTSFRRLETPLARPLSPLSAMAPSSPAARTAPFGSGFSAMHNPVAGAAQPAVSRTRSAGALRRPAVACGEGSAHESLYPQLQAVSTSLPQVVQQLRRAKSGGLEASSLPPATRALKVDRSAHLPCRAGTPPGPANLARRYARDHRAKGPVARPVRQPPTAGATQTPARRYALECESNGIMPFPMPFVTGHSMSFSAWDKVLVDNDLLAAAVAVPSMTVLEEVDLEGNRVLTDRSLVPLLESLVGHPAVPTLKKLSLKYCVQAGRGAMESTTSLLASEQGARNLVQLNLSGLSISTRVQRRLCEAIRDHPVLKQVCLADVSLGASAAAKDCVGDLLRSKSMESLDLGWNCFSAEVFSHLGACVVKAERLRSLSVSNCSAAHHVAGDAPSCFFLEHLSRDETLTHLDVSLNRINFCGALVIEDTLENHRRLSVLRLSQNPLGAFGMRSLLRLLSRNWAGLLHFHCDNCTSGVTSDTADTETQVFNVNNPGGRYSLDLARPYHRSLLRMLYKTMDHFHAKPDVAFTDVVYSLPPYAHPAKDSQGLRTLPTNGKLSLTFNVEKGLEAAVRNLGDSSSFSEVLEEYYKQTRLKPGFKKVVPLFAFWKSLEGQVLEQVVVLDALSKDFRVSYPQMAQLCESKAVLSEVICRLLHCVEGGRSSRYLAMLHAHTLGEFIKNFKHVSAFLAFNVDNPTGHYQLDLGNSAEHNVAEQLLLLDRWEAGIARRQGRFPVSLRGDYTQVRNETFQSRPLPVPSIELWKMPENGSLELDYVTGRRPPPGSTPLDQETFDNIMLATHQSTCAPKEIVMVLRVVSSHVFWSAMQLRALLGFFAEDADRAEVFVLFIMRVVDMHNEKVFRVRFADKPEELAKLRRRLGCTTLFPFIQPEQMQFELNLSIYDERLCATLVVELASRESPLQNLRNPSYIREDGTRDPMTLGVPRSWAVLDKCPTGGIFRVSYECSPEDRCFSYRTKLMETYGYWTCKTPEDDVMWWSALTEAPTDVLEFLEFLVSRYDDLFEPFKLIDGIAGNGQITLREFEDAMKSLKCSKFKGRNESQRIANVFRYLDPSGEGQISEREWGVLGNLWGEMRQSIREFVHFLERTFADGEEDALEQAWDFIDDDASGEITKDEWDTLVQEGLRYFGPCSIIFQFLDKNDEGSVSLEEFRALEVFRSRSKGEDVRTRKMSVLPPVIE